MQGGRGAILELIHEQEMREFFRACGLEPEMLEQAALTAAFLSARERCVSVPFFVQNNLNARHAGGPVNELLAVLSPQSNRML